MENTPLLPCQETGTALSRDYSHTARNSNVANICVEWTVHKHLTAFYNVYNTMREYHSQTQLPEPFPSTI